jgi:hypothetical protein
MSKLERRFSHGDTFETPEGLQFRVVRGKKQPKYGPNPYENPHDLRLDVMVEGRWRPVNMETTFLMVDFFYENEDVLYPRPRFEGGKKFLDEMRKAARSGWQWPTDGIEIDRAR